MKTKKANAKRPKVHREAILSERRLNILNHLLLFSVSTIEQIRRDVLKNCSRSFAYYEIGRLEKSGYIERMAFFQNERPMGAWILTPKGFEYIHGEVEEWPSKKYRPGSLVHDLELVDIAYRLKKCSAVKNYYTENAIYSKRASLLEGEEKEIFSLFSDAIMELVKEGKSYFFAVEYEASLKYKDKRKEKINRYYDTPELYGGLFVCKTREMVNRIKSMERKDNPHEKEKIYYGTLEEVKKSEGKLTFFGRDGAKLCLS